MCIHTTRACTRTYKWYIPVPNPPNPVVTLVVVDLLPKTPKPVGVPKFVGAVLVVLNPPNRLEADVVVVVPNPLKPPKLNVVVVAAPNPLKPVVEAGVLPKVEVVPNPVVAEDAGVLPKAGVEPKALVDAAPNVGADPKPVAGVLPNPVVGVLPNPVAVGVPNPVPVPNPVAWVDEVPNKLGVEVVGVLNPKEGVPNPATLD